MSEHCEATYRENLQQRLVRQADDDPAWQDATAATITGQSTTRSAATLT